jgi:hypothetical protein
MTRIRRGVLAFILLAALAAPALAADANGVWRGEV